MLIRKAGTFRYEVLDSRYGDRGQIEKHNSLEGLN